MPTRDSETEHKRSSGLYALQSWKSQIVFRARIGDAPSIIYWGRSLPHASDAELELLSTRQRAFGTEHVVIEPSLSNEIGKGYSGPPGLIVDRGGKDWAIVLRVVSVNDSIDGVISINCADDLHGISATYRISLDPETDILEAQTEITNHSPETLNVHWCSALCLPIDQGFKKLISFTGKWAGEFQIEEISDFSGGYVRENKSGRTSHDCFPGVIAQTAQTNEETGAAIGLHLGWSGNSRIRVDRQASGESIAQIGELLFPGEIALRNGQTYMTPKLFAGYSPDGLSGLSQRFHKHLTSKIMSPHVLQNPRPVHFNTWEALYFDHSEEKLYELAELAASVGAERFIIDDGWFGSRRSDKSGLGDWEVSSAVYPDGLSQFADKVRHLGMQLGIWVEPEMVNPDSDLYGAHPDWVLEAPGVEQIPFRHQLVLDLTREDVTSYLFSKIDQLIQELGVAYLKWDMNRIIHHPGSGGRPAIHDQTHAVYSLMEKLKRAHPMLEIESCASGGARADYGALKYCDRIWTSDNNDALVRQKIQKGASYFFPLSVMGAHVGPKACHITGRVFDMSFRAATAIFGHMGLELNLAEEAPEDLEILKDAIELHKHHRQLIHLGNFIRISTENYSNAIGVVAQDQSEALISYAMLEPHGTIWPERLRIPNLNTSAKYRTKLIWPRNAAPITKPSIIDAANLTESGALFTGQALMEHGIQIPLVHPNTCLIFHLELEF